MAAVTEAQDSRRHGSLIDNIQHVTKEADECDVGDEPSARVRDASINSDTSLKKNITKLQKIGTHCVHVNSASAERFCGSVKHYIHEIGALVSLDREECFALEKHAKTVI